MLNSDKDLFEFLSNAPKDFREGERIKKYQLKNGDFIHCVLWNMHFYITGTDIVKILIWRFQNAGRTLNSLKKFEEGIFSDLRNLKPGIDATLEGPRSEFLEFLYKNGCIRTQKKQKVFYWYSVPHDALFCDALERDLRRETNLYTYNKYMNNLTRHNTMGGFGVAHTRLNMKRLSSEYDHRFSRSMDSLNSRGNTPQFNRNKLPNMLDSQISMRKPEVQRNRIQQDGIMKNPMFNSSVPSAFSVKDKLFLQQSSAPKVYPEYDIFEEDMFFRDDKKRNDVFVKNDDKQINPSAIDKSIPENFSMDDFDFLRVRVEERMRKEEKNKKSEEKKVINSNNKQDNNLGDYKDFHSF